MLALVAGRHQSAVCELGGYLYIIGGAESWNCLNSVERYNPENNTWTLMAPMNVARRGAGVAVREGRAGAAAATSGLFMFALMRVEYKAVLLFGQEFSRSLTKLPVLIKKQNPLGCGAFTPPLSSQSVTVQLLELHLFAFGLCPYSDSNSRQLSWAGDPKQVAPVTADLDQAKVCDSSWGSFGLCPASWREHRASWC